MDDPGNDDGKKCGEAFLTLKGMIIFHCTLCENKYDEIQKFGIHIINKHIDFWNGFEILNSEIDSLLPDIPKILLEESSLHSEELNEFNFCANENAANSPSHIDEIELIIDDSYVHRCGEIFLTKDEILIFSCTLCDNSYKGVKKYSQHVIGEHYSLEGNEEVNFEILWPDNEENKKYFETTYDADANNSKNDLEIKGNMTIDDNNKECSNTAPKKIEKRKKPIPKWKQIFKTFYCSETNRELYECMLCSTIIKDKSNIHHHINRIHEQIKRFKCTECHKLFHASTEYKIHLRYHTGEKPYLCVNCGMAFVSNSELQRHNLKVHIKPPPDKACSICGKKFTTLKYLNRHKITHSEEKPFKCKICDTCFKTKSSLKLHNRIHENKRMYKCTVCSASYNYKNILVSHMKSKHAAALE